MKQTLILILFIFTLNCSNIQRNPDSSLKLAGKDTLINFTINGISKNYLVHKTTLSYLKDFQTFIDSISNNLEYNSVNKLQITSEGILNEYTTHIVKNKNGFLVTNTITQNDTIIWKDTLTIDDRVWYYWEDSIFFQLKPYSQFYIAYKDFRNFIGEPFDTASELYNSNKSVIHALIDYDKDPQYWDKYLGDFKGRLINNLSIEDGGIYIWDKRQKKFIDFYEP
jgi:hypothetical protein